MRPTAGTLRRRRLVAAVVVVGAVVGAGLLVRAATDGDPSSSGARAATADATPRDHPTSVPAHRSSIYDHIGVGAPANAAANDPARVYVPNGVSNTVTVIDQRTRAVVSTFRTAMEPQHIVPSFDLRTLWVLDNKGGRLVPIDAATGMPGAPVRVDDPYNLYFTPDGSYAIVVAEKLRRLDFRDPHTMALRFSIAVPGCAGVNHADYDGAFRYLIMTCEFNGKLAKIDLANRRVIAMLDLATRARSMPQDVRAGPDGRHFYVADMLAGGVFVVDGDTFTVERFVPTGIGAHGVTISRDGTKLYVANRGSDTVSGAPHGPGSVSVLDPASDRVVATWPVPGGGSPDMGNVNAAGTELWLSGRFDAEVYVFDTSTGALAARIPVGQGPHGLAVWPQPGRFSLGHTGNMR